MAARSENPLNQLPIRLEILGTRRNVSSSAPGHTRHAGVLIDGAILLDLGEMSYLRRHPRLVFITHLHPDHAAFLLHRAPLADIYLPERCSIVPTAMVITRPIQIGEHVIAPMPTKHATNARSLGYIVRRGGRQVFYSSDMISIDRRFHWRLERLDLVVTDGSFMPRGGLVRRDPTSGQRFGHAGIPDLVPFSRRFTRRILVTHFGRWSGSDNIPFVGCGRGRVLENARRTAGATADV